MIFRQMKNSRLAGAAGTRYCAGIEWQTYFYYQDRGYINQDENKNMAA